MNEGAFLPDPSERLASAYRRVQDTRMSGLPFLNAALSVEAVAFAPWEAHWLGAIVTPWFINLALAPRDVAAWRPLGRLEKRRYAFPAGDYEFIGASDDDVGELQICPLFSPVLEFEDHATARLVAALAREAIMDATHAQGPDPRASPPLSPPGPIVQLARRLDAPVSRRDLLRGRFLGPGDEPRR